MALTQVSTGGIKDGQVQTADLADSQVTAAKLHADALDRTYTLGADGSNHYTFTGEGLTGAVNDPTLYLTRGKTYRFVNGNSAGAHPFRIQTTVNGSAGTEYNTGVTNNGGAGGSTIVFEVPHAAPDVLYYQCTSHGSMGGILYVTGALADGTVTTAKLADDAVTGAKIADDTINSEHYVDGSIDTAHIADQAVDLTKLPHGTSSNDGKFLRANNGADPTFETVNTDLVADTSPQLGGDLASNGNDIVIADNDKIKFGTGGDLEIFHQGFNSKIADVGTGSLILSGSTVKIENAASNETQAVFTENGAVELYHNNSKKFETTSGGATITGTCTATAFAGDGSALTGITSFVSGMIIMYNSTTAPSGWYLCDGNNGTPDLRDRFIVGAGNSYSQGATGGANSVTLTVNQIPAHAHTFNINADTGPFSRAYASGTGYSKGTASTSSIGGGSSHENRPPYYALTFIMKA